MDRRRRSLSFPSLTTIAIVTGLMTVLAVGCSAPSAEFVVSNLAIGPGQGEILPGNELVVTATVANTGGAAGAYDAALVIDGAPHSRQAVDLAPSESSVVRFPVIAGAPGDHTIQLGEATANLHVTAVAVFEVSDVAIDRGEGEILPGDEVVVTARLENTGWAAGTYEAALSVDGLLYSRQLVELPAGQSSNLRFPVVLDSPGLHDVHLGDASFALRVLAPAAIDLRSLDVTPNPVEVGDPLDVAVTLQNSGDLSGSYPVEVLIDDVVAGSTEVTLAGRSETTVRFSVAAPSGGRHTVAVGALEAELVVWKIERHASGKILANGLKGGMGRLTIENGGDRDAVVILARSSDPSKTALAVYLRASKSTTITGIKDGTFVVYFRLGERWDSYSKSFTRSEERRRFEDTIRFTTTRSATRTTYSIWTISLAQTAGGNAPTDAVGAGDFPGIP